MTSISLSLFSRRSCYLLTSSVMMGLNVWCKTETACLFGPFMERKDRSLPAELLDPSGSTARSRKGSPHTLRSCPFRAC